MTVFDKYKAETMLRQSHPLKEPMFPILSFSLFTTLGLGTLLYKRRLKALSGPDLNSYGNERPADFQVDPKDKGLLALNQYLVDRFIEPAKSKETRLEKLHKKREMFDQGGLQRSDPAVEYRQQTLKVDGAVLSGSWTLVEGYDPSKRILYLHGGGNTVGSDLSHRPLTTNIAKRTKAAVFVPNYRLMPENPRSSSIEDCRAAYTWMVDNGPDGPSKAKSLAISGDSAGANLALTTANWLRQTSIIKPNAIVVFSAPVDSTLSSPSIRRNFETDLMLQPLFAPFLKIPKLFLLLAMKKMSGFQPTDINISPIHDDLSDLPPTLLQVSTAEMLHDDSVRYANKLREAGSPVILQSWSHVPHVFQMFDNHIQAAIEALDMSADFLNTHMK